jgi:hypothetical protein
MNEGSKDIEESGHFVIGQFFESALQGKLVGQKPDDDLDVVVWPLFAEFHDEVATMLREIGFELGEKRLAERLPNAQRARAMGWFSHDDPVGGLGSSSERHDVPVAGGSGR